MSRVNRFTSDELLSMAASEKDPLYSEAFLEIVELRLECDRLDTELEISQRNHALSKTHHALAKS